MIPEIAQLVSNIFDEKKLDQKPTRQGYGEGLAVAGDADMRVVALAADLTESTYTHLFKKKYPERFIEVGVAEQNMAGVASGMAAMGKIPFIASYAMFSPGRNWEQIRTTICYNDQPVKIAGCHAGISVGADGATHQALEDTALMRALPNMIVLSPCDAVEAKKVTLAAARSEGPVYIRLHREKTPVFTSEKTPFDIGKAPVFFDEGGKLDVAIIATGPLLYKALKAAEELSKNSIHVRVINAVSIKPLDEETFTEAAKDAGAIVVVEEHQIHGGLGSAIAEFLAKTFPIPMEFVGMNDQFGESGTTEELLHHFGMDVPDIIKAAKKVMKRKNQ